VKTCSKIYYKSPWCKICADELWVIGSGRINGSGCGGIGIVHQVLILARESRTPISEVRSGVGVKRRCLNEAGIDQEDYLIF